MTTLARLAPGLILAVLAVPQSALAAYQVYTDSKGNFAISFGSGNAYACGSGNICQIAQLTLFIINYVLVPIIFAIAFIVFIFGVAQKYIFSRGDGTKVSEGHKLILWGLIGFVVMISLWGLVNVVANTFGLGGQSAPATPVSTPIR